MPHSQDAAVGIFKERKGADSGDFLTFDENLAASFLDLSAVRGEILDIDIESQVAGPWALLGRHDSAVDPTFAPGIDQAVVYFRDMANLPAEDFCVEVANFRGLFRPEFEMNNRLAHGVTPANL